MDNISWDNLPDIYEVRTALRELVSAKAQLRAAELSLAIAQADIAKEAPRNTAARVVGVDAETRQSLINLQRIVIQCKNGVDHWEAEVKFHEFRRDCAKTVSYKSKM